MTRPSCKVIWISCGCMFWWFFFAMGHLASLSSKIYKISPAQIKITFFTLLYIYIVLHTHVKSYIYIYTHTHMTCKSQTILHAQHWIIHNTHLIIVYKVKYWELKKILDMDSSGCITGFLCITGQYWLALNKYLQFTMGLFENVIWRYLVYSIVNKGQDCLVSISGSTQFR
jgi:hypothetical protein